MFNLLSYSAPGTADRGSTNCPGRRAARSGGGFADGAGFLFAMTSLASDLVRASIAL